MYSNYISRKEAGKIRRELKGYKIACWILASLLAILGLVAYEKHKEQQHEIYALQNNCVWHYKNNGFEVCK